MSEQNPSRFEATPDRVLAGLWILGVGLIVIGVALAYTPAGFIVAGLALLTLTRGVDEK